jgi:UTP-glucose-1-phosphate uridylyltransferase
MPDTTTELENATTPEAFFFLAAARLGLTYPEIRERLEAYSQGESLGLSDASLSLIKRGKRRLNFRTFRAAVRGLDLSRAQAKRFTRLWYDRKKQASGTPLPRLTAAAAVMELLDRKLAALPPVPQAHLIDRLRGLLKSPVRTAQEIEFAVIPVAGWQAELLLDDYCARLIAPCVKEAMACGIEKFLLITRKNQRRVASHLQKLLKGRVPHIEVENQERPSGLGSVVQIAAAKLGDQSAFALLLPDDHLDPSCLKRLLQLYKDRQTSALAIRRPKKGEEYAGVAWGSDSEGAVTIYKLEENPIQTTPTSTDHYFILGRYVLDERVFRALNEAKNQANRRVDLTEALHRVVKAEKGALTAHQYEGEIWSLATYRRRIMQEIDKRIGKQRKVR